MIHDHAHLKTRFAVLITIFSITIMLLSSFNVPVGTPGSAGSGGEHRFFSGVPALSSGYIVSFMEKGLGSGYNRSWGVSLNGTVHYSDSRFVNFSEAPGNYAYRVISLPSAVIANSSGNVKVTTSNVEVTVQFSGHEQKPGSVPNGIYGYVSIVVDNNASAPTPSPFQEYLVINSSLFKNYENANLSNVEFFYTNGSIVPSWLESGNSLTSTRTIYWLRFNQSIGPHSNITIFMGFSRISHITMNGKYTGEAPQLTNTYGIYDSGRSVFSYYSNFSNGNGTIGWHYYNATISGAYKGLTIYPSGSRWYYLAPPSYGSGVSMITDVTSLGDTSNVGFFNVTDGFSTPYGAFIRPACGVTYPDIWSPSGGEINGCGDTYGNLSGRESVPGIYSVDVINSTSTIQFLDGSTGESIQPITDPRGIPFPLYAGFEGESNANVSAKWLATMNAPPGGKMPYTFYSPVVLNDTLYRVNFTESGLPSGGTWIVSIGGNNHQTGNPSYTMLLGNGTYNVFIPSEGSLAAVNFSFIMTINGSAKNIPVQFVQGYSVFFFLNYNISSQLNWWITIRNFTANITQFTQSGFLLPAGNYTYSAGSYNSSISITPSQGSFTASSNTVYIYLSQTLVTFPVSFKTHGLKSGDQWRVTVVGQNGSIYSQGKNFTFNSENGSLLIPNGTYVLHFSDSGFFYPQFPEENVTMDGKELNVTQNYYVGRNITFLFRGLLPWTKAYVTLRNYTYGTANSSMSLGLPNGSFVYRVSATPGMIPSSTGGTINQSGNETAAISFSREKLNITLETSLPNGYRWNVVVNGNMTSYNSSQAILSLPYGYNNLTFLPTRYFTPSYAQSSYGANTPAPDGNLNVRMNVTFSVPNYGGPSYYSFIYVGYSKILEEVSIYVLNITDTMAVTASLTLEGASPPQSLQQYDHATMSKASYGGKVILNGVAYQSIVLYAYVVPGNYSLNMSVSSHYFLNETHIKMSIFSNVVVYVTASRSVQLEYIDGAVFAGITGAVLFAAVTARRKRLL
ncbi:MAG: hypothetical protein ACYDAZ_03325 [Thermoplasmataceae archaeon]